MDLEDAAAWTKAAAAAVAVGCGLSGSRSSRAGVVGFAWSGLPRGRRERAR
jgi:hypothetical protein